MKLGSASESGRSVRVPDCLVGSLVEVTSHEEKALTLLVLGPIELSSGDEPIPLPRSKKTRAILAYLALTGRSHRRTRLSQLFWDIADDPRGALRWSLSKLRPLFAEDTRVQLITDRDSVGIEGLKSDFHSACQVASRVGRVTAEELEAALSLFRGEPLEGLELADFDELNAWIYAERQTARRAHIGILTELISRFSSEPERALLPAQKLARLDPYAEAPRIRLATILRELGRIDEARLELDAAKRAFSDAGRTPSMALKECAHELQKPHSRPPVDRVERAVQEPGSPSRLIGRSSERAQLHALIDETIEKGALGAVLLSGETGIGKTRLLHELRARSRERGGIVIEGRAFEAEQNRPFAAFIDALEHADDGPESKELASVLRRAASDDARRIESLSTIAATLRRIVTGARVALLTLDDLQWIDDASSELLHYLVRSLRDCPVVLALTVRRGELPESHEVASLLRALRRDRALVELSLVPLGPDEARELFEVESEGRVGSEVDEAGGNPLYTIELARSTPSGGIPSSLRALVLDRVEMLPEEARELLRWGAVLGRAFDPMLTPPLTRLDADAHLRGLDALERRGLLVVTGTESAGELCFAHRIVHRVVYAELSDARRRIMHMQVVELLESRGRPEEMMEVIRHAELAKNARHAAQACLALANQHMRVFARSEASRVARRGLEFSSELPEPDRTRLAIELHAALLAARTRDDESLADAPIVDELAERALDLGLLEHARLAFHVGSYLRWEEDRPLDAERMMMRAEEISRESEPKERARALSEAARCLVLLERDLPKAEAWLREADALARRQDFEPIAIPDALAMLHLHRGELERAGPLLSKARDLARRERDVQTEMRALENLVVVALCRSECDEAAQHAEELVRRIEREPLSPTDSAFARGLLALCRIHRGDVDAEKVLTRALETLRSEDAKRRLIQLSLAAADAMIKGGRAEQARTLAREALLLAEQMERPSDIALAHACIVLASMELGDREGANEHRAKLASMRTEALSSRARNVIAELRAQSEPGAKP